MHFQTFNTVFPLWTEIQPPLDRCKPLSLTSFPSQRSFSAQSVTPSPSQKSSSPRQHMTNLKPPTLPPKPQRPKFVCARNETRRVSLSFSVHSPQLRSIESPLRALHAHDEESATIQSLRCVIISIHKRNTQKILTVFIPTTTL